MSYIIKNTSGLINTRLTDVGRRYLSQGNFNISYFQLGDSEVNYSVLTSYNISDNNILMPAFNAQNDVGVPQSNKQNIKYPFYVVGQSGNTYGIPFMDSGIQEVFNSAGPKGFFSGSSGSWSAQTSSAYTVTSNYVVNFSGLTGGTNLTVNLNTPICETTTGTPKISDYITIMCNETNTCGSVSASPILTYRVQSITPSSGTTGTTQYLLTLDRELPNFSSKTSTSRVYFYPSGMTELYDTITPEPYWETDTLNFETPCDVSKRENTLIWNMNIPWSVNPAGVFSTTHRGYDTYASKTFLGSKEYFGYQSSSGQTDTGEVFYYNSLDEKISVKPENQKAIAIIHYTNQNIDHVYGEKFATNPFDPQDPNETTGLARNFKLSMPTLLWHKTTGTTIGESFYIDPSGYDLCRPYYIKSTKNSDMNDPGIRYYYLWDKNPDSNGNLNRVGKVFPDQQLVVIDDEELVSVLSMKSNRNWTLPAPKLSLITPNLCEPNVSNVGILSAATDAIWVTYRLDNDSISGVSNSLHCNYYSYLAANESVIDSPQNVAVKFGPEFPFLKISGTSGFEATTIKLLYQKTTINTQPDPTKWNELDITSSYSSTTINGRLTMSGLTGTTYEINDNALLSGTTYDLSDYLNIPTTNDTTLLNFGDEYYFYGNIETDISATIYEMRYLLNLTSNQFTNTSNPSWVSGSTSYFSEVGLFNENKDLLVVSKFMSPQKRQGTQQIVIKLDF